MIRTMLIRAKLAQQNITLITDNGATHTGIIEKLDDWTVKLRLPDGVIYIPVAELVTVANDAPKRELIATIDEEGNLRPAE